MDAENELWGTWPLPKELMDDAQAGRQGRIRRHPILSFSHFLPRIELMPEKRFLSQPNLPKIAGSDFVRRRVDSLQPDVHIFGHTHLPWDMRLEGVRYRSWPLGSPMEQAMRIASIPTEKTERWHPLAVFDNYGTHYPEEQACWFSTMYRMMAREPESCEWAPYVAAEYCPQATIVQTTLAFQPKMPETEADRLRQEKYKRIAGI